MVVRGDGSEDTLLFSIWDAVQHGTTVAKALPRSAACRRNCEDCHENRTTGTQCAAEGPDSGIALTFIA